MQKRKIRKTVITIIILVLVFLFGYFCHPAAAVETPEPIVIQLPFSALPFVETNDLESAVAAINQCQVVKNNAHDIAEHIRALDYDETHPIIEWARLVWNDANDKEQIYQQRYNEFYNSWERKNQERLNEYYTATVVWNTLHEAGFNDFVIAGIIGNMMSECGGQTLNLNATITSSSGYYGLCQWSSRYYPNVKGTNLEQQLQWLIEDMPTQFKSFGKNYKQGFTYSDFCNLSNEQEVALAFAKCYERCGSGSYKIRKTNATVALEYFTK